MEDKLYVIEVYLRNDDGILDSCWLENDYDYNNGNEKYSFTTNDRYAKKYFNKIPAIRTANEIKKKIDWAYKIDVVEVEEVVMLIRGDVVSTC